MADFEIERPSVDVSPITPVYNVNPPHFTIEIHGSTQGLRGEKGDPGQDGRDGIDGINGIDGADGVSVVSIEQTTTSSVSGGTNIITATLSNGDVSTFEILNGEKGDGAKSFEYGDISDITSTSDDIYQDLASCVENQLPFVITDGDETYQALYSYKYSDYIKIYYLSSQDIVNTIELQGSPTVTVTEDTYGIQEKITNSNLLDYSLIDNTPTIPTDTSDLTNGAGFLTSESDPVFSASAAAGISSSDISDWNGKQDALVSGTNIKTINNNSILGSGNITISGGGSSTDVQINGTSIVVSDVANILTETAYNSSTNKIATMSDIPDTSDFIDKDVNNLTNYSLTTTLQANKSITKGIEYIVGTQAEATNLWTGVSTDTGCSSGTLYTGKVIIYHLPVAGTSTAATLNLTLPDGTTTGAKNVYRLATTTTTTNFAAGCDILMVYDGTNWKVNAYVDTSGSNTIGYQLRTNSAIFANKTGYAMNRYTLLFEVAGGLSGAATTIATGTTKTTVPFKYIPGGVIKYYSVSGSIANNSNFTSTGLWDQYALNLGYTFNTGSTLTSGKPVYMRCTVNADGTLSPDYSGTPSHPIVQDLPTTADNKVYVFLGQAYSTTNIELMYMHPIYEYKNGKIREYISETGGGGTITDVQVNSTSVVAGGVANVLTETAYDASTNKIATMSDLPTVPTTVSSFTNDAGYITGYTETDPVFTTSAAYGISSSDITNWNGKSNFSGSYNDLTDKPTIPTVNNATLTIQKNGTTVKTFTANASSNVTADITVPTKTSDLNNDSGFVTKNNDIQINGTSIVSNNVANIITETAYNSATNKIATMSDIAGNIYEVDDILAITSTSDANFVSLIDDIENNNPFLISHSYLGITETIKPTSEADMNGTYSIRFMNSFEYDGDGYTDFYETIQLEVSGSTVIVTDTKTPSLNHIGESKVNGTFVTDIITNTAYNSSSNKIATMSDLPSVPVTDVKLNGTSVVSSGVAGLSLSTTTWVDNLF